MSFFNFFGKSKQNLNQDSLNSQSMGIAEPVKMVDKSLFVEDQEPESKTIVKLQVNQLEVFMDQNFEWQGYNDGYGHPDTDFLETKLKMLRSDFRYAVDKYLDSKRSELGELRLHIIKTDGISTRLAAQLNERAKQFEINIHELDTQKVLSVADEGMVSSAIHAYRFGFIKGVEKFQQEKLFAGSTGLFN